MIGLQCLIYVCELMEHCDVVKFFAAVSESTVTLESILRSCVFDECLLKALEGLSTLPSPALCVSGTANICQILNGTLRVLYELNFSMLLAYMIKLL